MTNQNLTATKEARMFTQPMLEIYADDVKCAHGSTVGQLNDAALFYMRQRGISLSEAKLLLQNAFINEVIDKMQLEPLRDRLHYLVEKRFRGELNKCTRGSLYFYYHLWLFHYCFFTILNEQALRGLANFATTQVVEILVIVRPDGDILDGSHF